MNITIVLPWYNNKLPSGGILNMYGYAERMAQKGHNINIIYDCFKGKGKLRIPNIIAYNKRKKNTISQSELFLKNNIQETAVYTVNDNNVPDADYVIATALVTVYMVEKLSPKKGKKIYFIQGFENWGKSDADVYKTYGLGMLNIAVSKWLYELVTVHSSSSTYYLPNAIDDCFFCTNDIVSRHPKKICFMYVPIKSKGTYDLLQAIEIVHSKIPDIDIEAFGIYPRSDDLPTYINYTYNPTRTQLRELYNRCAIFVCASWLEGFGLTAGESMKCGCCLITTNNKGILDFSIDKKTAMICEPHNIKELAKQIEYIISNNGVRIKIAEAGVKKIQEFNWKHNIEQLERILDTNK